MYAKTLQAHVSYSILEKCARFLAESLAIPSNFHVAGLSAGADGIASVIAWSHLKQLVLSGCTNLYTRSLHTRLGVRMREHETQYTSCELCAPISQISGTSCELCAPIFQISGIPARDDERVGVLTAIHIHAQDMDEVDGGGRGFVCLLVKVREITMLEHTPTLLSALHKISLRLL